LATLGHYTVVEELGAGGMGVGYRARDTRLVALKVLPSGSLDDERARPRFHREALTLAKLNHPHIGAVYDFDTDDGLDFLVMEYVAGQTLADRLRGAPLAERDVLALGSQIARALEDAHDHGVVHRDLKPGNIMVSHKGASKVLDFGLALLLTPASGEADTVTMVRDGGFAGTLPYMAPEQLRNQAANARTDIHALGAVLYEMATGRRAFDVAHAPELVDAILNRAPVAPRAFSPRLSTELERIVLKCLEKDPEQRYQSAREVAIDLERLKSQGTAVPAPLSPMGRRSTRATAAILAVVAVGAVGLAAILLRNGWPRGGPRAPIESIAVLPLENVSGDQTREYVADGMTDALITELSRISALKVISRTSVMGYKGAGKPLTEIARELGVDAVIEGSVLHEGDEVRIAVQLIDGATDRLLWSDSYQREVASVLALQNDVARAVAREIRVTLTPQDERRLASPGGVNRDAYDAYLRGVQYEAQRTEDGQNRSIALLEKAVALDPGFAQGHARLALSYATFFMGSGLNPKEYYPKAREAALRALAIDDTVPEAYVALATVALQYQWDWPEAERQINRAITLNRSSVAALRVHASYLHSQGRFDEAFEARKLARALDPLSPFHISEVGYPLYFAARYGEALGFFQEALDLDSRFYWANVWIGQVLVEQGRYDEAIAEFERAAPLSDRNTRVIATLGNAYGRAGRSADARRVLDELRARATKTYVSAYYLALVHAGLDERDQVFEQLGKAIDERQPFLYLLNVEPPFRRFHADPRFRTLVGRIGIPTASR
jgi:serine/threonine-protein kinase